MEFSEVTVDEGTGSVTLRALFPNPERLLLPGMFLREEIQEGVRQGAVLAPQQGISHDQKGEPNALVVGPDNTVERRTITTDRAIGDQWLVTSGLKRGDRVIVEGIQSAKPGAKVVPEEYRPPMRRPRRRRRDRPGLGKKPSSMANFFIDRPVFAWVLAIVIMLTGALAITNLPIAQYPSIAPPAISIRRPIPARRRRPCKAPSRRSSSRSSAASITCSIRV